jgi:hypothetical protein
VAGVPETLPPPAAADLKVLRELQAATERAHRSPVRIALPASS